MLTGCLPGMGGMERRVELCRENLRPRAGMQKRRPTELQKDHAKEPMKILKRFMGDQDASMPLNTDHTSILNSAPLPVLRTVRRPPMFFSMMVIDMKRPIPVPLSGPLVVK